MSIPTSKGPSSPPEPTLPTRTQISHLEMQLNTIQTRSRCQRKGGRKTRGPFWKNQARNGNWEPAGKQEIPQLGAAQSCPWPVSMLACLSWQLPPQRSWVIISGARNQRPISLWVPVGPSFHCKATVARNGREDQDPTSVPSAYPETSSP